MDNVIAQAKHAASTADEAARKKLLQQLRDLKLSIEAPEDSIQIVILEVRSHTKSKSSYSFEESRRYATSPDRYCLRSPRSQALRHLDREQRVADRRATSAENGGCSSPPE